MAPLLRARLTCFYCGNRSAQKRSDGLRQWQCETCEAVNHLDSDGNFTDPPPADVPSPLPAKVRFAQAINRPTSPVFAALEGSLFCSTCIKNQHLVTQNLADYLPSSQDPRYAEFEARLPEYRKNLEQRYPQVCEDCEPRVRERIRATGYAAKTDHLRRVMEQTRSRSFSRRDRTTRQLVGYAGLLVWSAGLLSQMVWHGLGVAVRPEDGLRDEEAARSVPGCLRTLVSGHQVEGACVDAAYSLASWGLVLVCLSVWWNPTFLRASVSRATGIGEYYKLQIILTLSRLAAWHILEGEIQMDHGMARAGHAIMLFLNTVVSFIGLKTIRMDNRPKVSFHETPEPLLAPKASASDPPTRRVRPVYQPVDVKPTERFFPFGRLASVSAHPETTAYRPPTPPPDDDDEDAMDLDTPQKSFYMRPSVHLQQPTPRKPEPSPFYGRLPEAPISQAHRLRNPPNQPSFRKTPADQQASFFKSITRRHSITDTDSETTETRPETARSYDFAPGRFFTTPDAQSETGLESLFTGVFSLKDDPLEVRPGEETSRPGSVATTPSKAPWAQWQRVTSIALLCLGCLAWSTSSPFGVAANALQFGALGLTAVVAGQRLMDALRLDRAVWTLSDILILAAELMVAMALGYRLRRAKIDNEPLEETLGRLPLWYLSTMLVQEVATFANELRASVSRTQALPEGHQPAAEHQSRETTPQPPPHTLEPAPPRSKERATKVQKAAIESSRPFTRSQRARESPTATLQLDGLSLARGTPRAGAPGRNTRSRASVWEQGTTL